MKSLKKSEYPKLILHSSNLKAGSDEKHHCEMLNMALETFPPASSGCSSTTTDAGCWAVFSHDGTDLVHKQTNVHISLEITTVEIYASFMLLFCLYKDMEYL